MIANLGNGVICLWLFVFIWMHKGSNRGTGYISGGSEFGCLYNESGTITVGIAHLNLKKG